jgi:hypothetical protein
MKIKFLRTTANAHVEKRKVSALCSSKCKESLSKVELFKSGNYVCRGVSKSTGDISSK